MIIQKNLEKYSLECEHLPTLPYVGTAVAVLKRADVYLINLMLFCMKLIHLHKLIKYADNLQAKL